ncbi:hypothetical protein ACFX12_001992 [Malus domestica]
MKLSPHSTIPVNPQIMHQFTEHATYPTTTPPAPTTNSPWHFNPLHMDDGISTINSRNDDNSSTVYKKHRTG